MLPIRKLYRYSQWLGALGDENNTPFNGAEEAEGESLALQISVYFPLDINPAAERRSNPVGTEPQFPGPRQSRRGPWRGSLVAKKPTTQPMGICSKAHVPKRNAQKECLKGIFRTGAEPELPHRRESWFRR